MDTASLSTRLHVDLCTRLVRDNAQAQPFIRPWHWAHSGLYFGTSYQNAVTLSARIYIRLRFCIHHSVTLYSVQHSINQLQLFVFWRREFQFSSVQRTTRSVIRSAWSTVSHHHPSGYNSSWWNENWQGKLKYWEKTCPSATLSATNSMWLIWGRTWTSVVGNWRLTSWSMTCSFTKLCTLIYVPQKFGSMTS
jgi:hypothetical protein